MKCPNCGAEGTGKFCEYCGSELPRIVPEGGTLNTATNQTINSTNTQTVINNYYYGPASTADGEQGEWKRANVGQSVDKQGRDFVARENGDGTQSTKNKWVALVLCICFGYFGAHHFYVGKIGKGILYLFTVGFFCIGWWIDIIRILSGSFKDVQGRSLIS